MLECPKVATGFIVSALQMMVSRMSMELGSGHADADAVRRKDGLKTRIEI